jgi:hypothetical protein
MTPDFKRGDHVKWNSEAGQVRGTIQKKVTREITFKGYKRHGRHPTSNPPARIISAATEFLHEYLFGKLSGEERAEFDKHLAECPWCFAYLDSYQKTIQCSDPTVAPPMSPSRC